MTESIILYRLLSYIPYIVGVVGATVSGTLVYFGLATKLERRHFRLRVKEGWEEGKQELISKTTSSNLELFLKRAQYPLGITALKFNIIFLSLFVFLFLNYIFVPVIFTGIIQLMPFLTGLVILIFLHPSIPFSPTGFLLNRLIEYRQAKKNTELFSLYDMLVSEIEMMKTTRVNIYSLLRSFHPYFKDINKEMATMLSNWSSSTSGPSRAIESFAEAIGTNEAKNLATVLQTFDDNSRESLIESLRGMEDLFITSQIENNRRKHKMFLDIISMPVSIANFLILLNFVMVIIIMVMAIMGDSSLQL
jgi:hypothetical protein